MPYGFALSTKCKIGVLSDNIAFWQSRVGWMDG
jgi:hypothetical protein